MKAYTFHIFITVVAEDECDAAEHLVGELDAVVQADNRVLSYTHPDEPSEVENLMPYSRDGKKENEACAS